MKVITGKYGGNLKSQSPFKVMLSNFEDPQHKCKSILHDKLSHIHIYKLIISISFHFIFLKIYNPLNRLDNSLRGCDM